MSWNIPVDPVSGTVITVAWARSNLIELLKHLRLMTGNADPPGSNYVVVSDSPTSTSWRKVPDDALADQKVSQGGDVMSGALVMAYGATVSLRESGGATRWALRMDDGVIFKIGDPNNNAAVISNALSLPAATTINGNQVWHAGDDGPGSGLDADMLDGYHAADLLAASGASVPSGLIAAFATAAAIAAGWTRYTAADGRFLIGAGTTFSQTFTEATNYGSAWTHQHAAVLSVSGSTGTPTGTSSANTATGGGTHGDATDTHTHPVTGSANGTTSDATWMPPSRAVVWAIKS